MHLFRLVAFHEGHVVAVPGEEGANLVVGRPGQHGRVGDLVSVEVEDREDGAVAGGIQKADPFPGSGQRAGLCLAVPDDRGDDEVRVIEGSAERVAEDVAKLAALVNRARRGDADVAGDAARRRELAEQAA
jgi:hypothetical protein